MNPTTPLIKINNVLLPKLKGFEVSREKLYSTANRNMAGNLKAAFIGIFPKITLSFTNTSQVEMSTIISLLDLPSFTCSWWDELTDTVKSSKYYAGSYKYAVFKKSQGSYMPFTVDLIPYNKYT